MGKTVEVPEYDMEETIEVEPARTALIVVDMQNDFVDPDGALFVEEARETIENCQRVLSFARDAGLFVGYTQGPTIPSSRSGASTY